MANYNQVSYGSSDSESVKKLQELLNNNGANLSVDGKFGPQTQDAVKKYQQANGLDVDGIAGEKTWSALTNASSTSGSSGTATTPETPAVPEAPAFEYGAYEKSDVVKQAEALLQQQISQKPGAYQSAFQDQLMGVLNNIQNREQFSYDLNKDALYQQLRDQYTLLGQQASMDVMGQAAALTGGYGNSYAQSVGQQAYQGYLQQLNDRVPDLYQLSLDQYIHEGDEMYKQASLLAGMEEQDYGRYRDQVADYNAELGRLTEDARYQGEQDYGRYMDALNLAYGMHRDKIGDQQWQDQFDEAKRQYDQQYALSQSKVAGSTPTGNPLGDTITTITGTDVSDSIKSKLSGFTNNTDLANYLDGLTASGTITESQADALYAEYKQPDQVSLNDRSWTLQDDGGINWFWGIDNNAIVKDQYGNTYRLDKLVDALVADGMSKSDAKTYVKNLQAMLGA